MKNRSLEYVLEYFRNPARWREQTALPTLLNLPITDNCNSRCVMCDVWKTRSTGEMSPAELGATLRDPLFARLRHVGISGGEPTLRPDLVEVVQAIVGAVPSLKSLSITTHGFLVRRWEKTLAPIKASCDAAGVRLTLNVSVDGDAEFHDRVRRVPQGFDKCLETRALARRLGVDVEFHATISSANVYNVGRMAEQTIEQDVTPVFRQATVIERLDNRESMSEVDLSASERSFFADFLRSVQLDRITRNPARRLFYQDVSHRLIWGNSRRAPCYFQREGILLSAHGDLFHCSISSESIGNVRHQSPHALYFSQASEAIRRRVHASLCPGCVHDQAGAWSPTELAAEVFRWSTLGRRLQFGVRALRFGAHVVTERLRAGLQGARPAVPLRCERVAVIGAYGGEHVGDAAILGGVLLRMHAKYATRSATVLSTRPDRTRTWVDGLRLPVRIDVADYDRDADRIVRESEALVFGGGPIMDLPELMVRHLRTATSARSSGRPFLIEGVGIGPFRSRIVKGVAAALLRRASVISVRSDRAARASVLHDQPVSVSPDPAFDYLATRVGHLDAVRRSARTAVEETIQTQPGALRIGVNLRPQWAKYADGSTDLRELERQTVAAVADGLTLAQRWLSRPFHVTFFAMNADAYGFSDLSVGHALAQRLKGSVTVKVCEHELLVDEVLLLLTNLDAVVAMRFHGAIFALAAGLPTIGIEYRVGRPGKVTDLFTERGLAHRVDRVDTLRADWLANQLVQVAAADSGVRQAR